MPESNARQGVLFAISAYTMWGIAPLFFKQLVDIPAPEILIHRIIWSFLLLFGLLVVMRRLSNTVAVLRNPKQLCVLALTSVLLGGNWLLFIWAVNNNHLLDASLGYYINPLLNVALGMMFLSERLRRLQWFAVALALTGVVIQLVSFGSFPVIAFTLAISFGIYGLLRKKLNVDAMSGLLLESLILLPLALGYWLFFADSNYADMTNNAWHMNTLLIAAGAVTTAPLLCFIAAAQRLKYSTLGFFQYIGPSLMFILAVSLYGEVFTAEKAVTFGFIWAALVVFSFDGIRNSRKKKA